jgi:hypothetical protein
VLGCRAGGPEEIELGGAHTRRHGSHSERLDGGGRWCGFEMEACEDKKRLYVGGGCGNDNRALLTGTRGETEREAETAAGEAAQRETSGQTIEATAEHEGKRFERVDAIIQLALLFEVKPCRARDQGRVVLTACAADESGACGTEPRAHGSR